MQNRLIFLLERVKDNKENVEEELISLKNLQFCQKQTKGEETRYLLYFVYSNKRGRVYAVTFEDKIVVITMFPIGKTTLNKYKRKFKS